MRLIARTEINMLGSGERGHNIYTAFMVWLTYCIASIIQKHVVTSGRIRFIQKHLRVIWKSSPLSPLAAFSRIVGHQPVEGAA